MNMNGPFGGHGMNGLFGDDEDMDMEDALARLMMMNAMLGGGMPGMPGMMDDSSTMFSIPGVGAINMKMPGVDPEIAAKIKVAVEAIFKESQLIETDDPRLITTTARLTGEQNVVKTLEGYVSQLVAEKTEMKKRMGRKDELFEERIEAYDKALTNTREKLAEAETTANRLERGMRRKDEVIKGQDNALNGLHEKIDELIGNMRNQTLNHQASLEAKDTEYSNLSSTFAGAQLTISDIKDLIQDMTAKPLVKDYKATLAAILESIQAHEDANAPTPVEDSTDDDTSVNATQENAAA